MSSFKGSPVSFGKDDVEIIAREPRYKGFFSIIAYRFRHRLFNGEMSAEVVREVFERGHAAVLLPYDAKRDEVVLIEQIRIPALIPVIPHGFWRWSPVSLKRAKR
jgi:ADP-ribose pyrophosphatase